jgi:steroid delta-isomerase-like uncharacterized protein
MSEENKAIARRFYEEIVGQDNLDAIEEVFAADYVDHDPANEEQTRGTDGVRAEAGMYKSAFPDMRFTIHEQIAEGDLVVTRWTNQGTHEGELQGMPATGKSVSVEGMTIHRIADGKIAEGWWNWDTMGLMRQLGAISEEQPA